MTFKERIIRDMPNCVLCGGSRPSVTVEHIPSRILFDGKVRPLGLEVGACKQCNSASRKEEVVVALISRLFPDPSTDELRLHLRKIMGSAFENNPGLMQEMYSDQLPTLIRLGSKAFSLPSWDFVEVGGPICKNALREFAFKLGAVLHYHFTGRIVPVGGGVLFIKHSNIDAFTGAVPELLAEQGEPKTLSMGKLNVADQFRYSSIGSEDGTFTNHLAVFREAFALSLFVAEDAKQFNGTVPLDSEEVRLVR